MILGLVALLAVIFLLITCSCGTFPGSFTELPFDTKEHLIPYHTEGQGEDREVPLLSSPVHKTQAVAAVAAAWGSNMAATATMSSNAMATNAAFYNTMGTLGGGRYDYTETDHAQMYGNQAEIYGNQAEIYGNQAEIYGNQAEIYGNQAEMYAMATMEHEANLRYEGIALPDDFIHHYYAQKAGCITAEEEETLVAYAFEGQGSPAGSVGCCSLLEPDHDLRFLDHLGSKFKTLAEVCSPPPPEPLPYGEPRGVVFSPSTHGEPEPPAFRPVYHEARPAVATTRHSSVGGADIGVAQSSLSPTGFNQSSLSPTGFTQSSASHTGFNQSSASHTGFTQSSACSHTGFNQSSSVYNNNNNNSMIAQSDVQSAPVSPILSPVPTAGLPSGGQTFVLQQQPPQVYYAVQQPMHYIVQPQMLQMQTLRPQMQPQALRPQTLQPQTQALQMQPLQPQMQALQMQPQALQMQPQALQMQPQTLQPQTMHMQNNAVLFAEAPPPTAANGNVMLVVGRGPAEEQQYVTVASGSSPTVQSPLYTPYDELLYTRYD